MNAAEKSPRSQTAKPQLPGVSPDAAKLYDGLEIHAGFDGEDLREMSKIGETTNVAGLPVHALARPPREAGLRDFGGAIRDLPHALIREIRGRLRVDPPLLVRGSLAGGSARPLHVSAVFPQSAAHLARALQAVLWPERDEAASCDLHILQIPDFPEQILMFIPRERCALILGTDDPRPGLLVALEAANRQWREGKRQKAKGKTEEWGKDNEKRSEAEATLPEMILLPGGCFVFDAASASGSEPALLYCGESVPHRWEESLVEADAPLVGRAPNEIRLAGAEPWAAGEGGWATPLWFNPPLPASWLAASPGWTEAALHTRSLPFGVRVDEGGAIDLPGSPDDAFVVVPRFAVPAPFARSAAPCRPRRLITHSRARDEARRLWAMGFPNFEEVY